MTENTDDLVMTLEEYVQLAESHPEWEDFGLYADRAAYVHDWKEGRGIPMDLTEETLERTTVTIVDGSGLLRGWATHPNWMWVVEVEERLAHEMYPDGLPDPREVDDEAEERW